MDFRRAKTFFIIAIIPFDQIAVHLGGFSKPGQFASSAGALQGTGENFLGKTNPARCSPKRRALRFAAFRQRQIGETGVLARKTPSRFAVARLVD